MRRPRPRLILGLGIPVLIVVLPQLGQGNPAVDPNLRRGQSAAIFPVGQSVLQILNQFFHPAVHGLNRFALFTQHRFVFVVG